MTDANRDRAAVLIELLAHDPVVRRAVVSWPLVPPRLKKAQALRAWGKVAGIDGFRIEAIAPMLFAHKVCLPDRTVDPEALRIIQHLAADTLRRKPKR